MLLTEPWLGGKNYVRESRSEISVCGVVDRRIGPCRKVQAMKLEMVKKRGENGTGE
jgi:hypothetical protein